MNVVNEEEDKKKQLEELQARNSLQGIFHSFLSLLEQSNNQSRKEQEQLDWSIQAIEKEMKKLDKNPEEKTMQRIIEGTKAEMESITNVIHQLENQLQELLKLQDDLTNQQTEISNQTKENEDVMLLLHNQYNQYSIEKQQLDNKKKQMEIELEEKKQVLESKKQETQQQEKDIEYNKQTVENQQNRKEELEIQLTRIQQEDKNSLEDVHNQIQVNETQYQQLKDRSESLNNELEIDMNNVDFSSYTLSTQLAIKNEKASLLKTTTLYFLEEQIQQIEHDVEMKVSSIQLLQSQLVKTKLECEEIEKKKMQILNEEDEEVFSLKKTILTMKEEHREHLLKVFKSLKIMIVDGQTV